MLWWRLKIVDFVNIYLTEWMVFFVLWLGELWEMEHFWDTPCWSRKTISRVTYMIQAGQRGQARDDLLSWYFLGECEVSQSAPFHTTKTLNNNNGFMKYITTANSESLKVTKDLRSKIIVSYICLWWDIWLLIWQLR